MSRARVGPAGGSALGGLRRLPRLAAAWSAAFTAVGLLVLGPLLVRADSRQRETAMDGELHRVTSSIVRQVYYEDFALDDADVKEDELYPGCPQFVILPWPAGRFAPSPSGRRDCVAVDQGELARLAVAAAGTSRLLATDVTGTDGRPVRVLAEPFRQVNGQYVGAVVAVMDAAGERRGHRTTVLLVLGGCVLLVAVAGAAGHLLAGRAVRPAATALQQQEALLADTAHDLRTPVAALRALAESALLNPAQRTELLPRTVELAGRMGTIIDGVLIRARLAAGVETLAIEPLWLDQLVAAVVEETPADGAQVTVTAAATRVDADAALVQRAVGNLLDNALRHGRQAGQPASVHITVAGGRIVVADRGPGIDPALARAAFDRFRSTGGSSGLGLSIVRWVAQAHGGTLRVYNAEEGGAIFELTLPTAGS